MAEEEVTIVTSSMVVDVKSISLLESASWNEILDAFSAAYLSVYEGNDPRRPHWLYAKEELSHFVMSLSSQPLTVEEIKAIASRISSEHNFNTACRLWAGSETKWILRFLSQQSSLMAGFMSLPGEIGKNPGVPAPEGHISSSIPMRVPMVHSMILVLASMRRVSPVQLVDPLQPTDPGFKVHADGSVSRVASASTDKNISTSSEEVDEGILK